MVDAGLLALHLNVNNVGLEWMIQLFMTLNYTICNEYRYTLVLIILKLMKYVIKTNQIFSRPLRDCRGNSRSRESCISPSGTREPGNAHRKDEGPVHGAGNWDSNRFGRLRYYIVTEGGASCVSSIPHPLAVASRYHIIISNWLPVLLSNKLQSNLFSVQVTS